MDSPFRQKTKSVFCACAVTSEDMYRKGCLDQFGKFVMKHAAVLGGAGVGIVFIQLLGVVLACLLAKHIRTNYESV
jgi:CD63 antigen